MSCTEVLMVGSGSAYSPGRCTSSLIILTPDEYIVLDYGTCTIKALASLGVSLDEPLHLFTHRHADHTLSAGLALFYQGFKKGPRPFRVIAGQDVLDTLISLRKIAVITGSPLPPEIKVEKYPAPGETIGITPRLKITFLPAKHTVPAHSIAITYDDATILVSGDTSPTTVFREHAEKAELAIHEATLETRYSQYEEFTGHSTVVSAIQQVQPARLGILYHLTGSSAREAEEKTANLTHILPARDGDSYKVC
ncbi:MAG: MBL fold metallo-hydrolase [Desulfurococcales archaeon]|nr:MBL fold metallo-hydrolase [Desulfurococcales archaeon]